MHALELDLLDLNGRLLVLQQQLVCGEFLDLRHHTGLAPCQFGIGIQRGTELGLEMRLYIRLHPLQRQLLQLDRQLAILRGGLTLHRQRCAALFLGRLTCMQLRFQRQIQRLFHGPVHILDLHGQRCQRQRRWRAARGRITPVHHATFQLKLLHMGRQRLCVLFFFRASVRGLGFLSNCSALLRRCTQTQPVDKPLRIATGINLRLDPAHRLQRDLALQRPHIGQLQLQGFKLQQGRIVPILQLHSGQSQLAADTHHRLLFLLEADLQVRI